MNCSQLYLGTNELVEESSSTLFSIRLCPSGGNDSQAIREVLGTKYVYYLAPHTDCGCGWDFLDVDTPTDDDAKRSCELLRSFIQSLVSAGKTCKIYSACIDSIGVAPEVSVNITANAFIDQISDLRIGYSSDGSRVFSIGI
jgi:hypothetical protein